MRSEKNSGQMSAFGEAPSNNSSVTDRLVADTRYRLRLSMIREQRGTNDLRWVPQTLQRLYVRGLRSRRIQRLNR